MDAKEGISTLLVIVRTLITSDRAAGLNAQSESGVQAQLLSEVPITLLFESCQFFRPDTDDKLTFSYIVTSLKITRARQEL